MASKKCTKCGEIKPLSQFHKAEQGLYGVRSDCARCNTNSKITYQRSKLGLPSRLYSQQLRASRVRGHPKPNYTLGELRAWLLSKDIYHKLYESWVLANYQSKQTPSCDRLDDYKPYTLDNLRLVTWWENNKRSHSDMKNGINNKQSKAVIQLTKNGEYVKKYHSISHAKRVTGCYKVGECCHGSRHTSGGFTWVFSPKQ